MSTKVILFFSSTSTVLCFDFLSHSAEISTMTLSFGNKIIWFVHIIRKTRYKSFWDMVWMTLKWAFLILLCSCFICLRVERYIYISWYFERITWINRYFIQQVGFQKRHMNGAQKRRNQWKRQDQSKSSLSKMTIPLS